MDQSSSLYGEVAATPRWSKVWIVAGGPSAQSFDFNRLQWQTVLLVNEAYKLLTRPQTFGALVSMFSGDPRWLFANRALLAERGGENYACVALDTWPECYEIASVTYLQRSHVNGLSESRSHLCMGGNSGYAAINLAVLKGATEIHLVGYDMDAGESKFRQWAPRFRTMLPQLRKLGVRVTNHNMNSAIDAFVKED